MIYPLISVQSWMARAHHSSSGGVVGTSPGQDAISWRDTLTYTPTLAHIRTTQTRPFSTCTQLSDVEETSTWRKHSQTRGENATPHRQWYRIGILFFFSH